MTSGYTLRYNHAVSDGTHSYPVIRTMNMYILCLCLLIYLVPDCHHYYLVIMNAISYPDFSMMTRSGATWLQSGFLAGPGTQLRVRVSPLSQRQTSNGMTKPILYHKTHTAWQKSYCMSFAMPSYFPWIHGKTHVISAPPYPWLFPCSNLSLVSQLFAFDSTF